MTSLYRTVLTFACLTLFQLLATLTSTSATSTASVNCAEKCGNMNISYPFGINDGCFREGFRITCNDTTGTTATVDGIEIVDISLSQAQMRIYNWVSYSCNFTRREDDASYDSYLGISDRRYRFSNTRNKFTAVGCQTLATISDPYTDDANLIATGCISLCTNQSSFANNSTCSGVGCCQTPVPKGLSYYEIRFDPGFLNKALWDYSPCSYAFVAEEGFYSFLQSDSEHGNLYKRFAQAPVVLDWVLGNETCKEARLNKSGDYACVSLKSTCKNSQNGPGYTCSCSSGYQGNPYIHGGCTDIDECKNNMLSQCYGNCTNIQGSYSCSCPVGFEGNPKIKDGCRRVKQLKNSKIPISAIMLIVSLSTLLVAAIMYAIHGKTKLNRAREKCFRQNQRLFLQAQINAHQSVRFRIFSIKNILKATNNFDEGNIKGRGGQGIVYEGLIDCRQVAIKKAILVNERRMKEEFVKEMHILSLINHKNVVQILGCCLEVEVPILVYEFVSGGTLYQRIQQKNQSMSLGFRLRIAIDCASALTYLHYDSLPPIIHGDIKSSNILLDENNIAKISDFGASMLPLTEINETGVPGTYGYLDPESLLTGQLTNKSDVYSFAVVFLELLTGMKAVYFDESREKRTLAATFKEEGLESILDDEIKYMMKKEQIIEFSELLSNCLEESGSERPTMKKVLAWIRRIQEFDPRLLEESEYDRLKSAYADSCNYGPNTTQFFSLEHRVLFKLDCPPRR